MVFVDITNPWLSGAGLPASGPQSALEIHSKLIPEAYWVAALKSTPYWRILPGHSGHGEVVDMCGEAAARHTVALMIGSYVLSPCSCVACTCWFICCFWLLLHRMGFTPISKGGIDAAPELEPRPDGHSL